MKGKKETHKEETITHERGTATVASSFCDGAKQKVIRAADHPSTTFRRSTR